MEPLINGIINGKYNITLFVVIMFLLFHIYYKIDQMKEPMTDTDISVQIKEAVRLVYMADVDAIRNLSDVATKLQKDGLTIPGNLTVTGTINVKGPSTLDSTLMVKGPSTLDSTLIVKGPSTLDSTLIVKDACTMRSTFNYLPAGTVVAWTGASAPAGWALCDGQNQTPDLRGRFILGAGQGAGLTNRVANRTGGVEDVTLTLDQMPSHDHKLNIDNNDVVAHNRSFKGDDGADRTIRMRAGDGSLKEVIVLAKGGNQPHNNMPPFYVLAYIMKL